jgi:hypothetical protein
MDLTPLLAKVLMPPARWDFHAERELRRQRVELEVDANTYPEIALQLQHVELEHSVFLKRIEAQFEESQSLLDAALSTAAAIMNARSNGARLVAKTFRSGRDAPEAAEVAGVIHVACAQVADRFSTFLRHQEVVT